MMVDGGAPATEKPAVDDPQRHPNDDAPVTREQLDRLVSLSGGSGRISVGRVVHVLRDTELSGDVVAHVTAELERRGVEVLDEAHAETERVGVAATVDPDLDPDDELLAPPDPPVSGAVTAQGTGPGDAPIDATTSDVDDPGSVDHGMVDHDTAVAKVSELLAELDATAPEEKRPRRPRARERGPAETTSTDPIRMYLSEIGRVELLTAAEEVALAKRIERGIQARRQLEELAEHGQLDTLDKAGQRRLRRDIRDGHRAQNELTQANLRLVVSIAKRYVGRGLGLLDLVQEGNLGLMRAVEKFDHSKGFKFSTYATWWIRQAITRSIADQSRTIRIPVHMVEAMNRVTRTQRLMVMELRRDPTVAELAERCDLTEDKVDEILRISQDPLSLDSPVGDEEDSFLGDYIEDDRLEGPADAAARGLLGAAILEVLDGLTDREQEVVRLRFGIDDGRPRTLEEVGRAFGVTRERIRQIEAKTLAKLRHPHRSERLRGYLEGS